MNAKAPADAGQWPSEVERFGRDPSQHQILVIERHPKGKWGAVATGYLPPGTREHLGLKAS
jgi:hypothetical protein